jgi:hypothetical protein
MARNHIGVFQKDTSDRVDNEIDQHVKSPCATSTPTASGPNKTLTLTP